MKKHWIEFWRDVSSWYRGWYRYVERCLLGFGIHFETRKDVIVDVLIAKRGSYQWPFLHLSLIILIIVGAASAPIVANAYPGQGNELDTYTPPSAVLASLDLSQSVQTDISSKPRDHVITYTVKEGDTLSKVASDHGVSVDTIKWANDLKKDTLSLGQELLIPPVTGIVHKVKEGETIYSIAKKYRAEAQNIVNFPFNDFADPETFALNVGQTLVVPDGIQPEAPAIIAPRMPTIIVGNLGTGRFVWPTSGGITQYPSWYHMAYDIADNAAPGIAAADAGTVVAVEYLTWGYGRHAIIDHGNGYSTLYGHMQAIYVKPGDRVARGQIIGKMGSTGRSTGTHLHFEIRSNGIAVNPTQFFR